MQKNMTAPVIPTSKKAKRRPLLLITKLTGILATATTTANASSSDTASPPPPAAASSRRTSDLPPSIKNGVKLDYLHDGFEGEGEGGGSSSTVWSPYSSPYGNEVYEPVPWCADNGDGGSQGGGIGQLHGSVTAPHYDLALPASLSSSSNNQHKDKPPVECIGYQLLTSTSSSNNCLPSGTALCRSDPQTPHHGLWKFGIDRHDRTLKLWNPLGEVVYRDFEGASQLCLGEDSGKDSTLDYFWGEQFKMDKKEKKQEEEFVSEERPYLTIKYHQAGYSDAVNSHTHAGRQTVLYCDGVGQSGKSPSMKVIKVPSDDDDGDDGGKEEKVESRCPSHYYDNPILAFSKGAGPENALWYVDFSGGVYTARGCEWTEIGGEGELAIDGGTAAAAAGGENGADEGEEQEDEEGIETEEQEADNSGGEQADDEEEEDDADGEAGVVTANNDGSTAVSQEDEEPAPAEEEEPAAAASPKPTVGLDLDDPYLNLDEHASASMEQAMEQPPVAVSVWEGKEGEGKGVEDLLSTTSTPIGDGDDGDIDGDGDGLAASLRSFFTAEKSRQSLLIGLSSVFASLVLILAVYHRRRSGKDVFCTPCKGVGGGKCTLSLSGGTTKTGGLDVTERCVSPLSEASSDIAASDGDNLNSLNRWNRWDKSPPRSPYGPPRTSPIKAISWQPRYWATRAAAGGGSGSAGATTADADHNTTATNNAPGIVERPHRQQQQASLRDDDFYSDGENDGFGMCVDDDAVTEEEGRGRDLDDVDFSDSAMAALKLRMQNLTKSSKASGSGGSAAGGGNSSGSSSRSANHHVGDDAFGSIL